MDFPAQVFTGLELGPHFAWLLDPDKAQVKMMHLDPAAVDAGAASGVLRAGLVLGIVTATKKVKQYSDGAGDGTQAAKGILAANVWLKDPFGAAVVSPLLVPVVIQARIRGTSTYIYGIDANGLTDLKALGFIIEEDFE